MSGNQALNITSNVVKAVCVVQFLLSLLSLAQQSSVHRSIRCNVNGLQRTATDALQVERLVKSEITGVIMRGIIHTSDWA